VIEGRAFSYSRASRHRRVPTAEARNGTRSDFHIEIHPYLGFAYSTDWKGKFHDGNEGPITDWGFTNPQRLSPVRHRAPNKVIIGIVGGSVASIFAHNGTQALERELKRSPRYSDKDIEFVSLAVGVHKQPQQQMALNYVLALGGELDELINLDGFNEVYLFPQDNAPSGVSIHYPSGWHWLVMRMPDQEVRRRIGKIACLIDERAEWAELFDCVPLRFSITAHLIWRARDRRLAADINNTELAVRATGQPGLPHKARGPRNTYRDDQEMLAQLVANWERGSRNLHRTCLGHGIRYHHFLQPNQYVAGSKPLSAEEKKTAFREDCPGRSYIDRGYPLLREAGRRLCTQEGVGFRDLSLVFAKSQETFYYDSCCHFNQAGNEALASAIAAAMVETREPPVVAEKAILD
jgi:hypothetical protein